MGRLLTVHEKAAYQAEQDRAAVEGREPQWKSMAEFLKEGLTEEDLIWGSDSMRAYGRKGRYEANGTDAESDKDQGLKPTADATTVKRQTLPEDPGVTHLGPDPETNPPEHYDDATTRLAKAIEAQNKPKDTSAKKAPSK